MHASRLVLFLVVLSTLTATTVAAQESVWVGIDGGYELAGTYFEAEAAYGSVVLMGSCNGDRSSYDELASTLQREGFSVLSFELYGHAANRAPEVVMNSQETHDEILGRTSGDLTQSVEWMKARGVGLPVTVLLSGCVVAWSTPFFQAHTDIKTVVTFSGPFDSDGSAYIAANPEIAVLGISGSEDTSLAVEAMREGVSASANPESTLIEVQGGGHGAPALLGSQGQDLVEQVVQWISRVARSPGMGSI